MFYIVERWLGGTLPIFQPLKKLGKSKLLEKGSNLREHDQKRNPDA